jgi:hypothetical protein
MYAAGLKTPIINGEVDPALMGVILLKRIYARWRNHES